MGPPFATLGARCGVRGAPGCKAAAGVVGIAMPATPVTPLTPPELAATLPEGAEAVAGEGSAAHAAWSKIDFSAASCSCGN